MEDAVEQEKFALYAENASTYEDETDELVELVRLTVHADARFVDPGALRALLSGIENLLVQAACREVRMDEIGEVTGIAPPVRTGRWVLHGGCWVDLGAVERMLREAVDVTDVRVEAGRAPDGTEEIVARLRPRAGGLTAEDVRAACLRALPGRADRRRARAVRPGGRGVSGGRDVAAEMAEFLETLRLIPDLARGFEVPWERAAETYLLPDDVLKAMAAAGLAADRPDGGDGPCFDHFDLLNVSLELRVANVWTYGPDAWGRGLRASAPRPPARVEVEPIPECSGVEHEGGECSLRVRFPDGWRPYDPDSPPVLRREIRTSWRRPAPGPPRCWRSSAGCGSSAFRRWSETIRRSSAAPGSPTATGRRGSWPRRGEARAELPARAGRHPFPAVLHRALLDGSGNGRPVGPLRSADRESDAALGNP
ncbi:hypothetical protein LUX33_23725 [Actinomadura madurae]|uniref:hypothetical protein n=1 Tax=Actinomadura madurae TaxID=1993 RepID=UPI0020D22F5E|nr:hypothetical protein [Actinomadura madurae]MCP9951127.1 hypothetical protein [Actinomadura madurae]